MVSIDSKIGHVGMFWRKNHDFSVFETVKVSDLWQTRSLAFSEICSLMLFRIAWVNKLWLSWSIFVVTKGTYYGHMKILGCFHLGHSHISGHGAPQGNVRSFHTQAGIHIYKGWLVVWNIFYFPIYWE